MGSYDDPDFFLHEKWRLTKSTHQDYSFESPSPYLYKSSSLRAPRRSSSPPPASLRRSSSTCPHRSQSKKGSTFTRKCSSFAKEQKARFVIIKRCVSMLVRFRKSSDS